MGAIAQYAGDDSLSQSTNASIVPEVVPRPQTTKRSIASIKSGSNDAQDSGAMRVASSEPVFFFDGDSTAALPAGQPFWQESAYGAGTQMLTWPVESGVWALVVMNGDGSAGVNVDMTLGAKVPIVFGVGVGLLVGGIVVLLAGGTGGYFGARTPTGRER